MPARAPRVCGHCGGVHQSGERCPKAAARDRERKARHDARRPNARKRGYDREWEKARAEYLAAYPFCRRCGAKADLVDHIIPIRKAPHRRLDRTNFMALCTPCHSGWKQAQDKRT
ncbi:HNH endonuclease signature motif containing protein [uncultured Nitratireductor sp.]|uniref:HNH endonuclease n=1 Tax=uncultured Nitratireductor sp. TaxID=520953 RepID=UPI0026254B3A|nr:HNH endonuclease signature motif containing protein [uncultured Nitratireductor sp.]